MLRPIPLLVLLIILSMLSFILAFSVGSYQLSIVQLSDAFLSSEHSIAHTLVWELRAPRAYVAFITGAMLSLAGVLMQVLLRNPLADPYILGVSGGASVAALSAMFLGLSAGWLSISAFGGALISILLVFSLAHGQGSWQPTRLLLTGVVIAAGWGAMINFILSISPDKPLKSMLFWIMGDISGSSAHISSLLVLIVGGGICFVIARQLNILARGELQAGALGVSVKPMRIRPVFTGLGSHRICRRPGRQCWVCWPHRATHAQADFRQRSSPAGTVLHTTGWQSAGHFRYPGPYHYRTPAITGGRHHCIYRCTLFPVFT